LLQQALVEKGKEVDQLNDRVLVAEEEKEELQNLLSLAQSKLDELKALRSVSFSDEIFPTLPLSLGLSKLMHSQRV
jgi:hypothetical protein